MGQATRTTKLPLDFSDRKQGGINAAKRNYLDKTAAVLNQARTFYVDFFLNYCDKFTGQVRYFSPKHQDYRERSINADELRKEMYICARCSGSYESIFPKIQKALAEWKQQRGG